MCNSQPIHSKLYTVLHKNYVKQKTISYLEKKKCWNRDDMQSIAWSDFGSVIKNMKIAERISTIKTIYGWENTGSQKKRIDNTTNICPVCEKEKETSTHMFTCSKKTYATAWSLCKRSLEKIHTTPPIQLSMKRLLLQESIPRNTNSSLDLEIQQATRVQSLLGPFSTTQGFLHTKWAQAQEKSLQYFDPLRKHNPQWLKTPSRLVFHLRAHYGNIGIIYSTNPMNPHQCKRTT